MLISAPKMKSICANICEIDSKFEDVVSNNPLCTIGRKASKQSNFQSLVSSVVSQQLSGKAASTIHGRLQELVGGEINPQAIALQSVENLRSVGLSGAKTKTILERAAMTCPVYYSLHPDIKKEITFNWK